MAKIITITSGKGGVGKTGISLNLSLSLAQKGFKVCLFDADLGLANVNIITGLFPEYGLEEVIEGRKNLSDIVIRNYQGIDIIPGSSGVQKMADLNASESSNLVSAFMGMDGYDYFIIDTSAGISTQVLSFCRACHEMILVVTPEPTSLTDAYSLLKVLGSKGKQLPSINVIVNQVKSADVAKAVYKKLKNTVYRFLSIKLSPLGVVAYDPKVRAAIISQTPFLLAFPNCSASRCMHSMAKKLTRKPLLARRLPMELFWLNCLELCRIKKKKNITQEPSIPNTHEMQKSPGKISDPKAENFEKTVNGMENKITMLSAEIAQMHSLLLQLVEKKDSYSASSKQELDKPEDVNGINSNDDCNNCVVVPLKASKRPAMESLKAMEAELYDKPDMKPPKSGKLFFDFEAWLQAKSKSSN